MGRMRLSVPYLLFIENCNNMLQFYDFAFQPHLLNALQCAWQGIAHILERFFAVVEHDDGTGREVVGNVAQATLGR